MMPQTGRLVSKRLPTVPPAVMIDRCTGCGACIAVCRPRAISMEVLENGRKHALIHKEQCHMHGDCYVACPHNAIVVWRWKDLPEAP